MNQLWQFWHANVSNLTIDAIHQTAQLYPIANAGLIPAVL